eukprot:TRINITY_DN25206_c0_g1_i1.p1 TRINITY_DN25206_c0_g1~~TRINITY_DN25206_c0_g1_i1.p1  ORF type:complete len:354 (-),score=63.39 TRINITY_DN25206_c0_g1_i1:5-1066(-)
MQARSRGTYPHDIVFDEVQLATYPIREGFLTELNGLYVPFRYDCRPALNSSGSRFSSNSMADMAYVVLPARQYACLLHMAAERTGLHATTPQLPLIDEEYYDYVFTFDSVLRALEAGRRFRMAELGARWGTWGARAQAFHRARIASMERADLSEADLFFAEPNRVYCSWIHQVMKANDMRRYHVTCKEADVRELLGFILQEQAPFATEAAVTPLPLDLLHIDIQGGEVHLLRRAGRLLDLAVHRVILGTHGPLIHQAALQDIFASWDILVNVPFTRNVDCVVHQCWEKDYTAVLQQESCFTTSAKFGPICSYDGLIVAENPAVKSGTPLELQWSRQDQRLCDNSGDICFSARP